MSLWTSVQCFGILAVGSVIGYTLTLVCCLTNWPILCKGFCLRSALAKRLGQGEVGSFRHEVGVWFSCGMKIAAARVWRPVRDHLCWVPIIWDRGTNMFNFCILACGLKIWPDFDAFFTQMWNEIFSAHSWRLTIQVCGYMYEQSNHYTWWKQETPACLVIYRCCSPKKETISCYFWQFPIKQMLIDQYERSLAFCNSEYEVYTAWLMDSHVHIFQ